MKIKNKIFIIFCLSLFPMLIGNTNKVLPTPCEHEYIEEIISPTCVEQGYTIHTCSKCQKTYKDNYVEPLGHEYEEVIVEPTCTKQGFTTHYCKICGFQYADNYVDPKGHTYTNIVYEPTCTKEGYTVHKCEICKYEYKDNYVEPLGHEMEEIITEPTCSKGGYTTYTCKKCGYSYIGNETNARGHNFVEREVKATCDTYGYTEYICECGKREVKKYVKPLGHNYETVIIPATEGKSGYTKHTCINCGHTYLSDFVSSGEDGYIEEEIAPPQHIHNFVLTTTVDRLNKTIKLEYDCLCGESNANSLTVLFTNLDGVIVALSPVDGVVDYTEYNGEYLVDIIDTDGIVLKEFSIGKKEDIKPIIPDIPKEEHIHKNKLETLLDEDLKILTIKYYCEECNESMLDTLVIILKDSNNNEKVLDINNLGQVDLKKIEENYTVSIQDINGNLLEEIKGNNTKDEVKTNNKNDILGPVLIVIAVALAGGAVTVIILLNKKNKNKNTKI